MKSKKNALKKVPEISYSEIKDWVSFENLIAEYFRSIGKKDYNITDVIVEQSGKGSDGGRDILITFTSNDSITSFNRKWVVQCKFYKTLVNKKELAEVNIPTLIHEHKANGYLLVCKNGLSSKVTEMFENLRKNCVFNYNYEFWNGEQLKSKLIVKPKILKQFFPIYYSQIQELRKK